MIKNEPWRQAADRVRNWNRWGPEDQLGTLNFITPEIVAGSARLVKHGRVIPLGIPLDAYGPAEGGYRRNPLHAMTMLGTSAETADWLTGWGGQLEARTIDELKAGPARFHDDMVVLHLQAGTQWDALAHMYYDGQLYNGYSATSVTSLGATRNSIDQVARVGHVVGRGILLDVARHRNVPYLQPGKLIQSDELDVVADAQGVSVRRGDVLLVRTGWWANFLEHRDGRRWRSGWPGLSWHCIDWLHTNEISAIACDNLAVESSAREEGVANLFHILALRDMGLMLGEIWDLERLSADCAEDGTYEFQLIAQPLNISGAVGSPVHPIAIK